MFLSDTKYPGIISEDNEHVLRNHNILDETDHSFLMPFRSKHQTDFSVFEKRLWVYAEEIISIQRNPEGGFFFFFNLQMKIKKIH